MMMKEEKKNQSWCNGAMLKTAFRDALRKFDPFSYTHLEVYKRQGIQRSPGFRRAEPFFQGVQPYGPPGTGPAHHGGEGGP